MSASLKWYVCCWYFQVTNPAEFGDSWAIDGESCSPATEPEPCIPGSEIYNLTKELCNGLISVPGPFSQCHDVVDPTYYYEACFYDVCATARDDLVCGSFEVYAQACKNAGENPEDWRSNTTQCRKCIIIVILLMKLKYISMLYPPFTKRTMFT